MVETSPFIGAAGTASIIVPCFNGARFLSHTLDSLSAQTFSDLEVIVVDDGSTDCSVAIARDHPLAPTLIQQGNLGVAIARNRGMAAARGDWVAFLDQDDLWHQDRLATMMQLAERTSAPLVSTSDSRFALEFDRERLRGIGDGRDRWPTMWIAEGDETTLISSTLEGATDEITDITLDRLLDGAAMLTTAVMYRRDLAISAGGCAPHARALDDHVLNLNATRIAGPIRSINSRQLLYRVHPSSTTTVSPMVGPFLSMQAAIRLGGVFPREIHGGPNIDHLLYGLAHSDLTAAEQLAVLVLATKSKTRARWLMRWMSRRIGIR